VISEFTDKLASIIDDDPAILFLARENLELHGFQVEEATGVEACVQVTLDLDDTEQID
jgi:CheY-like chemotaxis protein